MVVAQASNDAWTQASGNACGMACAWVQPGNQAGRRFPSFVGPTPYHGCKRAPHPGTKPGSCSPCCYFPAQPLSLEDLQPCCCSQLCKQHAAPAPALHPPWRQSQDSASLRTTSSTESISSAPSV
jgi:hypothetical protein